MLPSPVSPPLFAVNPDIAPAALPVTAPTGPIRTLFEEPVLVL